MIPTYVCYYVFIYILDFAMLKARYAEILACFPESFEATVNVLQEVLDPSQIWEIVSATSGHNQKLLNTLILKMNNKEDLLDFCDNLEKIPGAPPLLMLLIEQLRKGKVNMQQNHSLMQRVSHGNFI